MEKLPRSSEYQLKTIEELLNDAELRAPEKLTYRVIEERPRFEPISPERIEVGNPIRGPPNADLSPWETSMTNPAKHQDASFRYLVHAVKPSDGISRALQNLDMIQQALAGEKIDFSARIDLLQTPHRIADKPVISCSLLDEKHRETWAAGGYILKVPADNVLKTCASDCGNL